MAFLLQDLHRLQAAEQEQGSRFAEAAGSYLAGEGCCCGAGASCVLLLVWAIGPQELDALHSASTLGECSLACLPESRVGRCARSRIVWRVAGDRPLDAVNMLVRQNDAAGLRAAAELAAAVASSSHRDAGK